MTGTAREFDVEEVEKTIGTDLRGSVLTRWADAPSVVADSIKVKGEKTSP